MECKQLNGLFLKSHTEKIQKCIKSVVENFYYIGVYLYEINEYKHYKEDGFVSFEEYYSSVLNMKKSTVNNLISIYKKFSAKDQHGHSRFALDDKFNSFSYSQLTEMLSIKEPQLLDKITPDMSIKNIRQLKKDSKVDVVVQLPGQINIVDTNFVEVEKVQTSGTFVDKSKEQYTEVVPESLKINNDAHAFYEFLLKSATECDFKSSIFKNKFISVLNKYWEDFNR